jgi:hypothetical protein
MTGVFRRLAAGVIVVLAALSPSQAQQNSSAEPLGDIARKQREARKHQTKATPPKVYTNSEAVTSADAGGAKPSSESAAQSESCAEKNKAAESAKDADCTKRDTSQSEPVKSKCAPGRTEDTAPDWIVVPAATEIRVNIPERKVVVPVRIGFSTPIPALSKVVVQISRTYVSNGYVVGEISYVDYVDYATVTAVVIGGTSYNLETDTVPLFKGEGAANAEVVFHLSSPLSIPR